MTLNNHDPGFQAGRTAEATSEPITRAAKAALEEPAKQASKLREEGKQRRVQAILDFAKEWRSREVIDPRTPEEIWG